MTSFWWRHHFDGAISAVLRVSCISWLTHTHTHYTHSVHTTQMQTLQLYICDAGKYATTRRQLQPWPALQHSQRSVHFLWDPRESPHCWPCTHRISQPQKKQKQRAVSKLVVNVYLDLFDVGSGDVAGFSWAATGAQPPVFVAPLQD